MKKIFALIAVIILFSAGFSKSQMVQKLGHINSNLILQAMPEAKSIKTNLESTKKELEEQLKGMMKEYQTLLENLQSQQNTMTETIRNSKITELKDLEVRIQEFQQNSQNELVRKETTLLEPVLTKIRTAIQEVAKEKGYSYVLDDNPGIILYKVDSNDITPLVKQKLGISIVSSKSNK